MAKNIHYEFTYLQKRNFLISNCFNVNVFTRYKYSVKEN